MSDTVVRKLTPLEIMKVMGISLRGLRIESKLSIDTLGATLRGTGPVDDKVRAKIAKVLCMKAEDIEWIEPGAAKAPPPGEVVAEAPSTEPPVKKAQGVCDVHFLEFNAAGECSYCDA